MSLEGGETSPKGGKATPPPPPPPNKGGKKQSSPRGGDGNKTRRMMMESLRLEISGTMALAGEDILCVLEKHTTSGSDVCRVRVFVLERLEAAAQFMYTIFQREIDTLHAGGGIGGTKQKEKGIKKRSNGKKKTDLLGSKKGAPAGRVQKGPRPTLIKKRPNDGDGSTPPEGKSARGDRDGETDPAVGVSGEHAQTQADGEDDGPDLHLSSDSFESDAEDADDWAETREGQSALEDVEGDDEALPQDLKPAVTRRSSSHAGKTSFICSTCGKNFSGNGDLKRHMMIHAGVKPFCCTVCDKRFVRLHHLKRHEATHGKPPRKAAKARAAPKARRPREPKPANQTFLCSYCGKVFTQQKCLKRHKMIHTGEKPSQDAKAASARSPAEKKSFLCSYCGKMFTQKSDLERHTMLHSGERPCKCSVCGKGFIRMLHLKIHELVHTGEKPITCTVCGKGFIRMHHLKRHSIIHTGEKSFTCMICGKNFSRKDYLKTHMRTHTVGENVVENAGSSMHVM